MNKPEFVPALAFTAMIAAGAAGCKDNEIDVGGELDRGISTEECFQDITNGRIDLGDQVDAVVPLRDYSAELSDEGIFRDAFLAVREDLINNLVFLAAIANIDGESTTLDFGEYLTGTVSEDFGNGDISTESTTLYFTADFGNVPSLDDTEIDLLVTDPSCSKLYGGVFTYDIHDYGYESGNYYVEEESESERE